MRGSQSISDLSTIPDRDNRMIGAVSGKGKNLFLTLTQSLNFSVMGFFSFEN